MERETIIEYAEIEEAYARSVDRDHRKKLGQFFTPSTISNLMVKWIAEINPTNVLDPAVGTGVLVRSLREKGINSTVLAHEIDDEVIKYSKEFFQTDEALNLIQQDYLNSNHGPIFDAVIANPPYLRHHDFSIELEDKKRLERLFGKIPNTSNIYVYFVLKIITDLNSRGRASIIIPSDWLNSNFGRIFKDILFKSGLVAKVIYFRNDLDPFSDNLSTATILFIDKAKKTLDFELAVVGDSTDDLNNIGNFLLDGVPHEAITTIDPSLFDINDKWGPIFEGIHHVQPDGWICLNDIAKSKRGIATGANSFFLVSDDTLKESGLSKRRTRLCVGRAKDVTGVVFTQSDLDALAKSKAPVRLLDLDAEYEADAAYIKSGVELELPSRFLLANRSPWFKQELRSPAQILVGVFGRDGVRFIWNKSKATNLTTFHGLYLDVEPEDVGVIVALLNSTIPQTHNRKTERSYGGGLQKVEPKDLLEMAIPDPRSLSLALKDQLTSALYDADQMKRAGIDSWRTPLDFVVHANRKALKI